MAVNTPASPWLHRCALFLAFAALVVIVSGAVITSTEAAARQSQSSVPAGADVSLHRAAALAFTAVTFGFALWMSFSGPSPLLGWAACAVLMIDAGLAGFLPLTPL